MSLSPFRTLYTHYEQESQLQSGVSRPWPSLYRQPLPQVSNAEPVLLLRNENQIPKPMTMKQLAVLPYVSESHTIYSKAGWCMRCHWKGIPFQTLLNMFTTPQHCPSVRLDLANGQHVILSRTDLSAYRLILECDGKPLSPLYGGPFWMHHFKHYLDYSIPHIQSITLLQADTPATHPMWSLGFDPTAAIIDPGAYYAIHLSQPIHLNQPGG